MPCAMRFWLLGCTCIVRNSVTLPGHQFTIVTKCYKFCMGDMLNAFEIVRKLIPQLCNGTNDRLGCGRQRIVCFILLMTNVLVLRQVFRMSMVRSGIVPSRLVHSIVVVVC